LTVNRGGRYLSVSARADKGKAVGAITDLFARAYGSVKTVGIGDSWNDETMLASVDAAYLVQKSPGTWEDIRLEDVMRVDGVGPRGWSRVVECLLGDDTNALERKYL
jgi:predicted mannosyl-3-phosphoglycerate phosphatase (HAD superfamily)